MAERERGGWGDSLDWLSHQRVRPKTALWAFTSFSVKVPQSSVFLQRVTWKQRHSIGKDTKLKKKSCKSVKDEPKGLH